MKRRRTGFSEAFSTINVTPLVDVMLVLLIIFVVTASLTLATVSVTLPDSRSGDRASHEVQIQISIAANGVVSVDRTEVDFRGLSQVISTMHSRHPESTIAIQADRAVGYQYVSQVLDVLQGLGIENVDLQTVAK